MAYDSCATGLRVPEAGSLQDMMFARCCACDVLSAPVTAHSFFAVAVVGPIARQVLVRT